MYTKNRLLAVAMALALAATTMPTVWGQSSGGGNVSNVLPTVESFSASAGTVNENDDSELLGTVKDRNKEEDIQSIKIELVSGPASVSFTPSERAVTSTDISTTSKPSPDGNGWMVWNDGGMPDGILNFAFQYTYTTQGTYTWSVSVKDEGAYQTHVDNVDVVVKQVIQIYANMVDDTGADDGTLWGGWAAEPGATAAGADLSSNFVKVENTGTTASQTFTVSFSAAELTAAGPSGDTINLDDGVTENIKFICVEQTSDIGPGAVDFSTVTLTGADADPSIECTFSGTGNFMYVGYEIQSLPTPLADDDYQAGFTVAAA